MKKTLIHRERRSPSRYMVDVAQAIPCSMETIGRPCKIIRVLARLNIGGPAIHAVLLTESMNHDKLHSLLVTGTIGSSEGDMRYFAEQRGVTPLIIPELGRKISWRDDLTAIWKLYRLFLRERPDIVHTHTAKAGTLGRLAAVLARVPVRIHTFHGHVFHGYFGGIKTKIFIWIERLLARFTTRIVAISEAQRFELAERYRVGPREKFRVIPLGLDLTALLARDAASTTRDSAMNDAVITLGLVGRLVPVKNPCMAIKVLEALLRQDLGCTVRLVVVGDGEMRQEVEARVRESGLDKHVTFAGWRQDSTAVYAGIDLILLTSLNEGTPVVLIEAMAAGIPFVATRVGGVKDLMTGTEENIAQGEGGPRFSVFANGVLADSGDVDGFAAGVAFLLRRRSRLRETGEAGRRFARMRFSRERLVRDMESLYEECLLGHSRLTEVA